MTATRRRFRASGLLGGLLFGASLWGLRASPLPAVAFYQNRTVAEKLERLDRLHAEGPIDVLVTGDSLVQSGFDARRFSEVTGQRTFNFAVASTDLHVQALLLRHVLLPRYRPKTVIWGIDGSLRKRFLSSDHLRRSDGLRLADSPLGGWSCSLGTAYPPHQKRSLLEWLSALQLPLAENADAHGTRESWLRWGRHLEGQAQEEPSDARVEETAINRWARLNTIFPPRKRGEKYDQPPASKADAREAFEEVLRYARSEGIRVYAYFSPRQVINRYSTERYSMGHRWVMETLEEFGVPVLNLSWYEPISSEPDYFSEAHNHMNRWGAALTAERVAEFLVRPDARQPRELQGTPSRAEQRALRQPIAERRVPIFAAGKRASVRSANLEETSAPFQQQVARRSAPEVWFMSARVRVEEPGEYELHFQRPNKAERRSRYEVRVDREGAFSWHPDQSAGRHTVPLTFHLEPGLRFVEIRLVRPRPALGFAQFELARVSSDSPDLPEGAARGPGD